MAEITPLFMDISSVYSGDELALPLRDLIGEGILGTGDLAVSAGAGNSVNIAAGSCYVLGDTNPTRQPCYRCLNDAVVNKGINPDPANPRRILVVAQIVDEAFAGLGRLWRIDVIHGTPDAAPVLPATPASALPLANILVPAAAASSAAYTITDLRPLASTGGTIKRIDRGLAFPLSPVDGQEFTLTDHLTTPTLNWVHRYNAGSTHTHKWDFVGGAPKLVAVAGREGTVSAAATDLATVGPSFAAPRAGVYRLDVSAQVDVDNVAGYADVYYKLAAAAAVNVITVGNDVAGVTFVAGTVEEVTVLTAGDVVKLQYGRTFGVTAFFAKRKLSLTPIRLS